MFLVNLIIFLGADQVIHFFLLTFYDIVFFFVFFFPFICDSVVTIFSITPNHV